MVHGKVDGNINGAERVELKKSAVVAGDISTQRVVIEDGAFFKGSIDIQRETAKAEAPRREPAMAAAVGGSSSAGVATPSPVAASASSFMDPKR